MKDRNLEHNKQTPSYFFYSILFLSIAYLIFESAFIFYGALAPDEFVFTRHIYEFTFHIPYRDFPPYKTILGYYILSIPMFFSHALLAPIFLIKNEIALINMGCILLASYWATRFFNRNAVLLSLLAILVNGMFLIYSTDLRVDMLTSWACLFSIFCVMENRIRLGGLLMSIAFLISQKALWYFVAINGAMAICWLALPTSIYRLRSLISFNISAVLPILAYIAFWSLIAGPQNVLSNMFYEAYIQEGINVYLEGYRICWQAVLIRGSLLFFLWPMTFLSLFDTSEIDKQKNFFIVCCSSIALELFFDYKQPFPYNFVFTVPALYLLYCQMFTWLFRQKDMPHHFSIKLDSLPFIFTTFFYLYCIGAIIYYLMLPSIIYLTIPLAISLLNYLFFFPRQAALRKLNLAIALILFVAIGILHPLYRSMVTVSVLDGGYQRSMLNVAAKILQNDSDYIAGIPFFYQKDQPIVGMVNLIEPAANYLKKPNDDLGKLLLPSLYLLPSTQERVLNDFSKYPVKLILDNYRLEIIPERIKEYIENNYQHFYGSILLYAPFIQAGKQTFDLKFDANYRVEAENMLNIDGKEVVPGEIVSLNKGQHSSSSQKDYRLALVPTNISPSLNPKYQKNEMFRMMKAIIA